MRKRFAGDGAEAPEDELLARVEDLPLAAHFGDVGRAQNFPVAAAIFNGRELQPPIGSAALHLLDYAFGMKKQVDGPQPALQRHFMGLVADDNVCSTCLAVYKRIYLVRCGGERVGWVQHDCGKLESC